MSAEDAGGKPEGFSRHEFLSRLSARRADAQPGGPERQTLPVLAVNRSPRRRRESSLPLTRVDGSTFRPGSLGRVGP